MGCSHRGEDLIFVNRNGEVAAGCDRDDAVVAGSGSPPIRNAGLNGQ